MTQLLHLTFAPDSVQNNKPRGRHMVMPLKALLCSLLMVLPLALPASAAAQEAPVKGDRIYVSATFPDIGVKGVANGKSYVMKYAVRPCSPLDILDTNAKKARWDVKQLGLGGEVRLEGAWLSRMHKSVEECNAQLSALGEPAMARSGTTFRLAVAAPK